MSAEHHDSAPYGHDLGLAYDLDTLAVRRRTALKVLVGAGLATLAGCGSSALRGSTGSTSSSTTAGSSATGATASSAPSASRTAATSASSAAATSVAGTTATTAAATSTTTAVQSGSSTSALVTDLSAIPEETAGPYPGDGSNGPNALTASGIVRSDIRSSLGSTAPVAGVLTTIRLQIVKAGNGSPVAGAAVYLWHCDQQGRYSMYSQGVTNETFLRGVQEADADGFVTFTTIFPGCYSGRWPHVHYEVYPSLAKATAAGSKVATSQLALPADVCKAVYATDGYSSSVTNLAKVTLATDMVFRDGAERETPSVSGDVSQGVVLRLGVPVSA